MDSKKSKKARIFLVVVILLSAAVWKYIGHEKKEKKIEITEAEADQTRVAFSMAEGDNPWTVKQIYFIKEILLWYQKNSYSQMRRDSICVRHRFFNSYGQIQL